MSRRSHLPAPLPVCAFVLSLLIVVCFAGCGGGSGGSTASGRVQIAMTDAAGPYANVVVSVKAIRVVPAGSEGTETGSTLPLVATLSPSQVIDVLTLQFAQTVLGQASVPAGEYSQVRLVLDPNPATGDPVNYVTLASDPTTKIPLKTPSGQQSGLKINGDFAVKAGELTALALDFDPTRAIAQAGNSGQYLLKPTGIRLVSMASALPTYGAISGTVLPAEAWPAAVVEIIPEGATTPVASGLLNPDDGSFRAFVPAGSYLVRITAAGYTTYESPVPVAVATGAEAAVGEITLTPPAPAAP